MARELEAANDGDYDQDEVAIILTQRWLAEDGKLLKQQVEDAHAFFAKYLLQDLNSTELPTMSGNNVELETAPGEWIVRRLNSGVSSGTYEHIPDATGDLTQYASYGNTNAISKVQQRRYWKIDDVDVGALDVVFCCLPHATTQAIIKDLPRGPKVVDLSADFRLRDPPSTSRPTATRTRRSSCRAGGLRPHRALPRRRSARSWLVANPGCYTTTAELPLIPLLRQRLIQTDGHHHRRQVRRQRRRARRQAGQPVHRGRRGHPRLRRRHPPPHARDRAVPRRLRRPADPGHLHPASDADEPRHPGHDLCPPRGRRRAPPTCTRRWPGLCRRALRPRPAVQDHAGDPPRARHQSLPDRRAPEPHPGRGDPGQRPGQSGQGRLGPGDPEHEHRCWASTSGWAWASGRCSRDRHAGRRRRPRRAAGRPDRSARPACCRARCRRSPVPSSG